LHNERFDTRLSLIEFFGKPLHFIPLGGELLAQVIVFRAQALE
jgi:hypothetical protein